MEVELCRLQFAALQVDAEDLGANLRRRQVDEEQFVEASLADQFGGRRSIAFAVATMKTGASRSAIQVSRVPSTR